MSHGAPPAGLNVEEILKKVQVCADLWSDSHALRELGNLLVLKKFQRGESILKEGELGAEFYILIRGKARVSKFTSESESYGVTILSGESTPSFGEGALMGNEPRSASITAEEDCECLVLKRTEFETFGKKFPHFALPMSIRIGRNILERLRKANSDLAYLYRALVDEIRGG